MPGQLSLLMIIDTEACLHLMKCIKHGALRSLDHDHPSFVLFVMLHSGGFNVQFAICNLSNDYISLKNY